MSSVENGSTSVAEHVDSVTREVARVSQPIASLIDAVGKVVVGQREMVEGLIIGMLCDGHVLLEGVPGLAKTLTVSTLASAIHADFKRIQFTPDLLPADLLGTLIYSPKDGTFTPRRGPIFYQHRSGGRDQPRSGQGAVGPARINAGTPGHDR